MSLPDKRTPVAHPRFLGLLALSVCVLCLYSTSIGHNFLFDEKSIIENNPFIKDLSLAPRLLKQGFFHSEGMAELAWEQRYRPLTSFTFALDYALWGLNPMGYNLTNTVIHLLVCLVLYALIAKAFGSDAVACLAALFFAVHTVHVEAVTYIASRSDPLGAFLMLAAIWCYWDSRPKAGLLLYGLGLFVKENTIFLPAYLLLLEVSLMKRTWRRVLIDLSPYAVAAVAFVVLRAVLVPVPLPPRPDFPGAVYRVLSMGWPVVNYLRCVLVPSRFEFGRQVAFAQSLLDPTVLVSCLVYLLLLLLWALTWRKRVVFFGVGLFLMSLFPCLQWMPFSPVWAEHYLYVPLIGLVFVVAFLLKLVLELRSSGARNLILCVYAAFLLFLSVKTWRRNDLYNDPLEFYRLLAEGESPYAGHGLQYLGINALENGRPEEAYAFFQRSQSRSPMATTENFLGVAALRTGRNDMAFRHFNAAYRGEPDEGYRLNMGVALMRMKRLEEATSVFLAVQARVPSYGEAYENLVRVHELSGNPRAALDWGERGLESLAQQETKYLRLLLKMAGVAYRSGEYGEMRRYLERLLAKNPDAFWYGDVAELLLGRLPGSAFRAKLKNEYRSVGETGDVYLLRSLVLRDDRVGVRSFLGEHGSLSRRYEDGSLTDPCMRREIEIALALIRTSPGTESEQER